MLRWVVGVIVALVAATATGDVRAEPAVGTEAAAGSAVRPRLAVVIVVDQFRYDTLLKVLPWIGEGGLKRLIREGAFMTNARYEYASTYTAPGHACIATGAYTDRTGIVANEYYDRSRKASLSVVFDPDYPVLGGDPADPDAKGVSPRALRVPTLGDALVDATGGKAKVLAVSLKERTAVMLAGHKGKGYWYNEAKGELTTSTYYMKGLPLWLVRFNERSSPAPLHGKTWDLAMPPDRYALYGVDAGTAEGDVKGLGRTFPHKLTGKEERPAKGFFDAFTYTPFANQYLLDAALAGIEAEDLGADDTPDLLGVSLTPPDLAGHVFGPDSWELLDMMVRLDGQLAAFLQELDKRLPGRYALALTGDHGSCPIPERMAERGYPAARIKKKTFLETVNRILSKDHGEGKWVLAAQDPCLYLDHALAASKGLDLAALREEAGRAALTVPGVAAYYTFDQLAEGFPRDPQDTSRYELFRRSFDRERSGDVMIVMKPYYFWGKYGEKDWGESHGTHHDYDTHVPLAFLGPTFKAGVYTTPLAMTAVCPTLARTLAIPPPSGAKGEPASFALR